MANDLPDGASLDQLRQISQHQAATPYRTPDPVATLRTEVAELRTQVASLSASLATVVAALNEARDRGTERRGTTALPPFVRNGPCRKCGEITVRVLMQRGNRPPAWENQPAVRWKYEPATPRFLFVPPTPERILRECQSCHAKYHESPLDADGHDIHGVVPPAQRAY